jgi:DNA-binding MarR family transcriptional regulator
MMGRLLASFDKVLESRVRLGIMSILSVNDSSDFTAMKDWLDVTDGNLASHLKTLTAAGYIRFEKFSGGRTSSTVYVATDLGLDKFRGHLDALEEVLRRDNQA